MTRSRFSGEPSADSRRRCDGRGRAGAAGFTLLEVIVATAVMGVAVIGLLSLVNQSLANAARIRQYDRAAMLARLKMNELLTAEPLPLNRRLEGSFSDDAGWEAIAAPYEVPGGARAGASILARIALKIWWEADGERKEADFEGFRRIRVRDESDLAAPPGRMAGR